jgi:hypothetical protein
VAQLEAPTRDVHVGLHLGGPGRQRRAHQRRIVAGAVGDQQGFRAGHDGQ